MTRSVTTDLEALVERANWVAHSVTVGSISITCPDGNRPLDAEGVLELFEHFLRTIDPDFRKHYVYSCTPQYGWQYIKEIR